MTKAVNTLNEVRQTYLKTLDLQRAGLEKAIAAIDRERTALLKLNGDPMKVKGAVTKTHRAKRIYPHGLITKLCTEAITSAETAKTLAESTDGELGLSVQSVFDYVWPKVVTTDKATKENCMEKVHDLLYTNAKRFKRVGPHGKALFQIAK